MSKLLKIEKCVQKGKEAELLKMLQDKDRAVRIAAIAGMGKIGKEDSRNALVSLLNDSDWEIRAESAKALGHIGDEHVVTHLRYLLSHETDERVKAEISHAISNLREQKHGSFDSI